MKLQNNLEDSYRTRLETTKTKVTNLKGVFKVRYRNYLNEQSKSRIKNIRGRKSKTKIFEKDKNSKLMDTMGLHSLNKAVRHQVV